MPTSQYFNHNDSNTPETNLLDDLVIESIKIYGVDCYYLRRDITAENDQLYGEDTNPTFTYARLLEMYVKNIQVLMCVCAILRSCIDALHGNFSQTCACEL